MIIKYLIIKAIYILKIYFKYFKYYKKMCYILILLIIIFQNKILLFK